LETRLGRSLSDDNEHNVGLTLKVDELIGFYAKGGMDFANMVFPYFVLGYSKVDLEFEGAATEQTESDISYGIGADFHFGMMQVGLEWLMMLDKSDYELDTLSLTAAYRF